MGVIKRALKEILSSRDEILGPFATFRFYGIEAIEDKLIKFIDFE